jgi:outer membrane protein TolC
MDQQTQETAPSAQHPQLENSDLAGKTAQAKSHSTQQMTQGNPSLVLYARRDRTYSFETYDNALGIGFSVPFATAPHGAGQVAEAEMQRTEAMAQQAEVHRKLSLLQEQSRQELESNTRRLALAEEQYEIALSRVRLTQRAFDLGESSVFLLLEARNEGAKTAAHLERSRIAYHQSISRYNLSLGVIPE